MKPVIGLNGTAVYRQAINVPFLYPVYFTRNVWSPANQVLAEVLTRAGDSPARTLIYVDAGVDEAHSSLIDEIKEYEERHRDVLTPVSKPRILPGGEAAKNGWDVVNEVVEEISRNRLCRHSFVIAVGGGAFLDVVGFAAAIVHRGIRLVRIPTTTLSQGDSGVGVKNGVNLGKTKNMVGTFAPPFAVINDFAFLTTLDKELILDGVAEAFKVGIIKDADFFRYLYNNSALIDDIDMQVIEEVIRRNAVLHLNHIRTSNDPFEFGMSRPLDFGHWSAHMLEGLSDYRIRHGQAVSVGIGIDIYYAWCKGLIRRDEMEDILEALTRSGLSVFHTLLTGRDGTGNLRILKGLELFREHLGGELSITLPHGIGNCIEVREMDTAVIEQAVEFLKNYGDNE